MTVKMSNHTLNIGSYISIGLFYLILLSGVASAESPYEFSKGLEVLSQQLTVDRSAINQKKTAVTDFVPLYGELGNLGSFLAEEIFTHLANNRVKLLERKLLEEALKELRLNMTDMVDPEHAKRFGRFTGTGLLLLGTVTDLPDTIKINARLIDIESRILTGVGSVEIYKTREVLKVMGIPYPGSVSVVSTSSSDVYMDGELVGTTDWLGRLNISPVKHGSHSIRIQHEGYRPAMRSIDVPEGTDVRVEAALEKLPSPTTAVVLSLIFPGAGDLYLGHDDWWIYPLAVGGSIYGAYAYSKKTEEIIWKDGGQYGGGKWEKRGDGPVYLFAGLAAAIWIYDIYHVGVSAAEARLEQAKESRLKLEFDPSSRSAMLVRRWTW